MATEVLFAKWNGAGNDFVIINDMDTGLKLGSEAIRQICDRHFGVGADGLILLRPHVEADYAMVYFNADGQEGSMCGNGARCAFAQAEQIGLTQSDKTHFMAYDGSHAAWRTPEDTVAVTMRPVHHVSHHKGAFVLDTGSPHFVEFRSGVDEMDVLKAGKRIRNRKTYRAVGINVNFVEVQDDRLRIRTYERGVENVTLACGTGAVAAAVAYAESHDLQRGPVHLVADGGRLSVDFKRSGQVYGDITLIGPAEHVFEGQLKL